MAVPESKADFRNQVSLARVDPDEGHQEATSRIISALLHHEAEGIGDLVVAAAAFRRFWGRLLPQSTESGDEWRLRLLVGLRCSLAPFPGPDNRNAAVPGRPRYQPI